MAKTAKKTVQTPHVKAKNKSTRHPEKAPPKPPPTRKRRERPSAPAASRPSDVNAISSPQAQTSSLADLQARQNALSEQQAAMSQQLAQINVTLQTLVGNSCNRQQGSDQNTPQCQDTLPQQGFSGLQVHPPVNMQAGLGARPPHELSQQLGLDARLTNANTTHTHTAGPSALHQDEASSVPTSNNNDGESSTCTGLTLHLVDPVHRPIRVAGLPLGTNIKQSVKTNIWQHKFVELSELLYPNRALDYSLSLDGLESSSPAFNLTPKKHKPLNEAQWGAAMDIFVAIYVQRYPKQLNDLLTYIHYIKPSCKKAQTGVFTTHSTGSIESTLSAHG